MTNRQIVFRRRPIGKPTGTEFEMVTTPVGPLPSEGVLRRTLYLSLDPYMRGRMNDGPSYAASLQLGQVMIGHTVGQVVDSRNPAFAVGDYVAGYDGWQEYGVSNGRDLRRLDPALAPVSTGIGVLGMPGMTAYVGLLDIARPKPGETVVVSAAAGAVGSIVGQIAKIKGCRAVGIAGSSEKCDHVVRELGFDACVNYKEGDFRERLAGACPSGIDVYFENVGGDVFVAVLGLLNLNARIPLCGLISQYNAPAPPPGPNLLPLLTKRAMIKGFIVSDHNDRLPAFLEDCGAWIRDGRLKYKEDIVDGLEQAPTALGRLFDGTNVGKLLVKVADPA